MKPQRADHIAPQPARVEFSVQFSTPQRVPRRSPDPKAPDEVVAPKECPRGRRWGIVPAGRPSKAALLLALAYHWERLVREGVVKDYADIARLAGLTRARVTQIMNLTLLAPEIQEGILLHERSREQAEQIREHKVRALSRIPDWNEQGQGVRGKPALLQCSISATADGPWAESILKARHSTPPARS